jgi:hypothetical protein
LLEDFGIPHRFHVNRVFTYDCNTRPTYHHAMAKGCAAIDTRAIMGNILVIRGHRVLLDSDLAALYLNGRASIGSRRRQKLPRTGECRSFGVRVACKCHQLLVVDACSRAITGHVSRLRGAR